MEDLLNLMRRESARQGDASMARTRVGLVDGYNPELHAVRVRLQPEDLLTGWMPLAVAMAGTGWGVMSPPSPGDQILVHFQEGDGNVPIACGVIFSDARRPPSVPSGEIWLVHGSGSRVRLLSDGSIDVNGPTIRIGADGATFRKLLDERFHAWATTHTHPGVGAPLSPPTLANSATTNLTGA